MNYTEYNKKLVCYRDLFASVVSKENDPIREKLRFRSEMLVEFNKHGRIPDAIWLDLKIHRTTKALISLSEIFRKLSSAWNITGNTIDNTTIKTEQ